MECRCACPASKAPKQKTGPEPGFSLWKPRRWSFRTQRRRIAAASNVDGSIDLRRASAAPSELKQTSSEQCSTSAVPVPLDINIVKTLPTAVSVVKLLYLVLVKASLLFTCDREHLRAKVYQGCPLCSWTFVRQSSRSSMPSAEQRAHIAHTAAAFSALRHAVPCQPAFPSHSCLHHLCIHGESHLPSYPRQGIACDGSHNVPAAQEREQCLHCRSRCQEALRRCAGCKDSRTCLCS